MAKTPLGQKDIFLVFFCNNLQNLLLFRLLLICYFTFKEMNNVVARSFAAPIKFCLIKDELHISVASSDKKEAIYLVCFSIGQLLRRKLLDQYCLRGD